MAEHEKLSDEQIEQIVLGIERMRETLETLGAAFEELGNVLCQYVNVADEIEEEEEEEDEEYDDDEDDYDGLGDFAVDGNDI